MRLNGGFAALGFALSLGSHGMPNQGDNNWVNDVYVAIVTNGTAWSFQLNGSVVSGAGGLVSNDLIELRYDAGTNYFSAYLNGSFLANAGGTAVAYIPVAWGAYSGGTVDYIEYCT